MVLRVWEDGVASVGRWCSECGRMRRVGGSLGRKCGWDVCVDRTLSIHVDRPSVSARVKASSPLVSWLRATLVSCLRATLAGRLAALSRYPARQEPPQQPPPQETSGRTPALGRSILLGRNPLRFCVPAL
eukprot:364466-Chlamydomonas_euryale.AAC.1